MMLSSGSRVSVSSIMMMMIMLRLYLVFPTMGKVSRFEFERVMEWDRLAVLSSNNLYESSESNSLSACSIETKIKATLVP
jgi:hypothetical protein